MKRGRDADPGNCHCNARKCLPIFYLTQPLLAPSTDHSAPQSSQQHNQNAFKERVCTLPSVEEICKAECFLGRAHTLVCAGILRVQAGHALFDSYHSVFSRSVVENELVCRMSAWAHEVFVSERQGGGRGEEANVGLRVLIQRQGVVPFFGSATLPFQKLQAEYDVLDVSVLKAAGIP